MNVSYYTTKKDIYGDLGSCYLAIGDLVNAEIILSTGFKIDAKNDRTLVVLGFYNLIKKDTEEAKKMWQKSNSHAMKKEFIFSYMLGCYVIYNLAQYNITEEDFQKIIDELQK